MRDDRNLLEDIRRAIEMIRRFTPQSRSALDTDLPLQSHLLRHLQIIGEAAWRVSKPLQTAHPEIPWQRIATMRHVLVHDYFRIDLDLVWEVVVKYVPALQPQVEAILSELSRSGPTP